MLFRNDPDGMRAFLTLFCGQLLTTVGSAMTTFGVSIWLFQQTGQATSLTLASGLFFLPIIILGPFAGTIADRYDRKKLMILTDSVGALSTILMLILLSLGVLSAWQIFIINFVNGAMIVLQSPTLPAVVTTLVDKKHYARCNAMGSMIEPAGRIVAPAAAAALIVTLGFRTILILDLLTFVFAVTTMALLTIPRPEKSAEGDLEGQSFIEATKAGFKFIYSSAPLRKLHHSTLFFNLGTIAGVAVMVPMILTITGGDEAALGSARSLAAIGAVVGGLSLSAWGGATRKMPFALASFSIIAVVSVFYGLSRSVLGWAAAGFVLQFMLTIGNALTMSIWQSKVPPDLQGRVLSAHFSIVQASVPIVMFLSGPLADNFFEPAMQSGGRLAQLFGWLVGTAPGSGMSLMFVGGAIFSMFVMVTAWLSSRLRHIETLVPDFDEVALNSQPA